MVKFFREPFGEIWGEVNRIADEMNRVFGVRGSTVLPVNLWSDEHNLYAEFDLPDIDPAKLEVTVNERVVLPELACDGILIATPAGSTAYNLSAQGPILPLGSALLALTPISPFRPRRWRGAILPDKARIGLRVLEPAKRPVSAVGDQREVRDVARVDVVIDRSRELTLLFDPEHALDDRITMEQFIA